MSTPMDVMRDPIRGSQPKLDGALPLLNVVTRKVVVGPGENIVHQGDVPRAVHLLLEGQTCRYKLLGNGRRQITAVLVPGDICDLEAAMRGRADYSVQALASSVLGEIPLDRVKRLDTDASEAGRALWRQLLRDEAIASEWIVGLGRRSARERLAHFICELRERMRKVGLGDDDTYNLHLTQAEMADALGLSVVHVNRTLQQLRGDGLIELRGLLLRVLEPSALADMAGFDPAYLEQA